MIASCQLKLGQEKEAVKTLGILFADYSDQTAEILKALRHLENARRVMWLQKDDEEKGLELLATGESATKRKDTSEIRKKLEETIIKKISFRDTPVSEVFAFLHKESEKTGKGAVNFMIVPKAPNMLPRKGMNIDVGFFWQDIDDNNEDIEEGPDDGGQGDDDVAFLGGDDEDGKKEDTYEEPTITINFENISLGYAIRYICEGAGLKYMIKEHAIVILRPSITTEPFFIKMRQVDSGLFSREDKSEIDVQK